MVIIDFAILQDDFHYHLANPSKKVGGHYREKFYSQLVDEFIHTDWNVKAEEYTAKTPKSVSLSTDNLLENLGIPINKT